MQDLGFGTMHALSDEIAQGSKIIKGLDRFNAVISSESGRQLLAMLGGSGGEE